MKNTLSRVKGFCDAFNLRVPILLAPMAGVSHPQLSIAVANAGGLGACGVVLMEPNAIAAWAEEFRVGSSGSFQLNTWIPDPQPRRNLDHECDLREFLAARGPPVPLDAGDKSPPNFEEQCDAMLKAAPPNHLFGHGPFFALVRETNETARDQMVRQYLDSGGSTCSGRGRSRCDRRAGCGSWRPSRMFQCG